MIVIDKLLESKSFVVKIVKYNFKKEKIKWDKKYI